MHENEAVLTPYLKGEKVDGNELTSLETAQKLFKKVLSEMGNSQEEIDFSPQMAYSKRKVASYINYKLDTTTR